MAEIKWIKLTTDLFDNRKIKQIRKLPEGDAIIGVWLQILCLAGSINHGGLVYFSPDVPYTEEMLSTEFDRPINIIRLAMTTFSHFGMMEVVNDIVLISNWEKYQSADKLEALREYNREKKREYRLKQKEKGLSLTSPRCPQTDNTLISSSISNSSSFKIPSIEDIREYCLERNKGVDAERYFDFYQSKGWMVGKTKMKDWQASVRTWEKDKKSSNPFLDLLKE